MTKKDEKLISGHPKLNKASWASKFIPLELLGSAFSANSLSTPVIFMSSQLMNILNKSEALNFFS